VTDSLITLAGAVTGRDYRVDGLTTERMGLTGLHGAALADFLSDGVAKAMAR
jgi:hypothetical protein